MGNTPCRLFVLLAREAPTAVIFRRGPSKWTRLILWNTTTDHFEPGEWWHGRLYEKRCDLSPNGSKLIYFASKQGTQTFTAISKSPSLSPLALWPQVGTYYGGGVFLSEDEVRVNAYRGQATTQENHRPLFNFSCLFRRKVVARQIAIGDDLYSVRLARDGWSVEETATKPRGSNVGIRLKVKQEAGLALQVTTTLRGYREHEAYAILHRETGRQIPLREVGWADWDQQGRFVFARQGKLFCGEYDLAGRLIIQQLADFNPDMPPLAEQELLRGSQGKGDRI